MEAEEPHPDVQPMIARQQRMQYLPTGLLGARGIRRLAALAQRFEDDDPPEVGRVAEGETPGPDEPLPVRTYRPESEGPYPTVVFFHGGGFVLGDLDSHDHLCRRLTVETGCEVVAVDYRLAPENPFPAAVEDAYAAVEWAADDPDALDRDGGLAVVGDSAGGNLAAVAALMAAERDGPDIDYQALLYPAVGTREDQQSMQDHAGMILSESDIRWFDECYYGSEVHRRNPYGDPSRACDLSDVAPATVVTAGFDPLRDGGKAYAEQLVEAGVATRFRNCEDLVHGFFGLLGQEVDPVEAAIEAVGDDLRDALDP
jgi:acetyl esterase